MPGVPWARNFETYPGRAMDIHFGSFPLTGTVHLLGNPHGALRKVGGAKFMIWQDDKFLRQWWSRHTSYSP